MRRTLPLLAVSLITAVALRAQDRQPDEAKTPEGFTPKTADMKARPEACEPNTG